MSNAQHTPTPLMGSAAIEARIERIKHAQKHINIPPKWMQAEIDFLKPLLDDALKIESLLRRVSTFFEHNYSELDRPTLLMNELSAINKAKAQ